MATKKLQILEGLGSKVYTQNEEPVGAVDGSLWVDLDEEGSSEVVANVGGMVTEKRAIKLPSSQNWRQVIAENGKFIAISSDTNVAAYSDDGITWIEISMPEDTSGSNINGWSSIGYGHYHKRFSAISASGMVAYSEDGINWTSKNTISSGDYLKMIYSSNKYIALSSSGNLVYDLQNGTSFNNSKTLPDGYTWTSLACGCVDIALVATAANSDIIAYSEDWSNWTTSTLPFTASSMKVTYGNDRFVAINSNSNSGVYSVDAASWSKFTLPSSQNWLDIVYGNDKFVAISDSDVIAYSLNGNQWYEASWPISRNTRKICYGNGMFVAVECNTDNVIFSIDGINWSQECPLVIQDDTNVTSDIISMLLTSGLQSNSSSLKIATGQYRGAGTCGSSNKNRLEFDFDPYMLIITTNSNYVGPVVMIRGHSPGSNTCSTSSYYRYSYNKLDKVSLSVSWEPHAVSWYVASYNVYDTYGASSTSGTITAQHQLNASSYMNIYNYVAIGK